MTVYYGNAEKINYVDRSRALMPAELAGSEVPAHAGLLEALSENHFATDLGDTAAYGLASMFFRKRERID